MGLVLEMSVEERRMNIAPAVVCVSVAVLQGLGYKDWLCCWSACGGMGCDSVAATEEEAGS